MASEETLYAQIREAPDEVEPYLILSDWLLDQGHPRGRLIALQHEQARAPSAELQTQIDALLEQFRPQLLPPDLDWELLECTWRLGFVERARLRPEHALRVQATFPQLLESLLMHPSASVLRALTIEEIPPYQAQEAIAALQRCEAPFTELSLGAQSPPSTAVELNWLQDQASLKRLQLCHLGVPPPEAMQLPNLVSLALKTYRPPKEVDLGAWTLPKLEHLTLESRWKMRPRFVQTLNRRLGEQLTEFGLADGDETLQPLRAMLVRGPSAKPLRGVLLPPCDRETLLEVLEEAELPDAVQLRPMPWATAEVAFDHALTISTQLERPGDVLEFVEHALARDPQEPYSWNLKGLTLGELDRNAEAIEAYLQGLSHRPHHMLCNFNLGQVYKDAKEYQKAMLHFSRAANAPDGSPEAWHCLGHMEQAVGKDEEAERSLQKAIHLYSLTIDHSPDDDAIAQSLFWRGAAQARRGKRVAALSDLRRAVASAPEMKEQARDEEDFEPYRDDPEFQVIVATP